MRVLAPVKASAACEAGEGGAAALRRGNEEPARAGMLLGGLQPGARGKRARPGNGRPAVTDGPFAETKELAAGFRPRRVGSPEDAVAWIARAPSGDIGGVEPRPAGADSGAAVSPLPGSRPPFPAHA